ncbi:MAG: hypothetical protein D6772_12375, partial [Bacteroidetes bacterium]
LVTLAFVFSPLFTRAFNSSLADVNLLHPDSNTLQVVLTARKGKVKPANETAEFRLKTIVIDAGHGGKDPGCSGPGSTEKHLTLAIAQAFAERVRLHFPDVQVILTRDEDVFIPLYERAAIANRAQADLFVSIHCNALPASKATWGSETYVMGLHTADHNLKVAKRENESILYEENYQANYDYDPNSPEGHILLSMFQHAYLEQSILFAERVEHHFTATAGRRSRGVKQAGFVVLKETTMPSVLVETGFLTSPKDEAFLLTPAGQAKVADALLAAFSEYKASIEGSEAHDHKLAALAPPAASPAAHPAAITPAPHPAPVKHHEQVPNAATTMPRGALSQTHSATMVSPHPTPQPYTPTQREPVVVQSELTLQARAALPGPATTEHPAGQAPVIYCVQLAASPSPLHTQSELWQGSGYLIEVLEEDHMFKYQVRNFKREDEAFAAQIRLQRWGFEDAFIVAYRAGQRISLEEARRGMR